VILAQILRIGFWEIRNGRLLQQVYALIQRGLCSQNTYA